MNTLYGMKQRSRQSGFTLIEIMISMLLGLIMMIGVVSLMIGNKRSFQEQTETSRIQENARFAIQVLAEDIRMASYVGCHDDVTIVSNNLTVDSKNLATVAQTTADDYLLSMVNPIEGMDSAAAVNWDASASTSDDGTGSNVIANIMAGTDAITVRYFSPAGIAITADNSTSPMTVDSVTGMSVNMMAAIADCGNADVFRISAVNAGGLQLSYAAGGDPGNTDATLSDTYEAGETDVMLFRAVRYFISADTDGNGLPNTTAQITEYLYVTQELLTGIENMQILYGNGTSFLVANDAGLNWDNVTSVKIALLLRSENEVGSDIDTRDIGTGANDYSMLGATVALDDLRVRRRVFNTTIEIRNRN